MIIHTHSKSANPTFRYHLYLCVCVCFHSEEAPPELSGRLYHLEVMLKQLNNDLERVRTLFFFIQEDFNPGLDINVTCTHIKLH